MGNGEKKFEIPKDKRFYAEPIGNRYKVTDYETNKSYYAGNLDDAKNIRKKILNEERRTFVPGAADMSREYDAFKADPTKDMTEEKARLYRLQNQIGGTESLQQDSSKVYKDVEKYMPENVWKPKVEMLIDDIERNKRELASYENQITGTGANRDYSIEKGTRKRAYALMKKIADDERQLERLKNLRTNQQDKDPLGLFND